MANLTYDDIYAIGRAVKIAATQHALHIRDKKPLGQFTILTFLFLSLVLLSFSAAPSFLRGDKGPAFRR